MRNSIKLIILFAMIFIASCVPEELPEQDCKSLILNVATENINTDFRITDVDNEEVYEDLYNFVINVDNFSPHLLILSPNKDLRVFFLKDSNWIQQANNINFPSKTNQIGVKSSNDPGGKTYSFIYDPATLEGIKKVCITLIAIEDPQGVSVPVGSYFELSLEK